MKAQFRIFGLAFVLGATNLTASETQKEYTLDELVKQALLRSDQITAQKAQIEEKGEAATQASAWENPLLGIGAGAKFASQQIGPVFQIGLSQLFFFPGKQGLRQEFLGFEKTLEEIGLSETELAITADVVRLSYEYAITERKVRFAENRKKRFELIKAYLEGHTFASPQQKTTSIIVKERLRNIGADTNQLQGTMQAALQKLKFYIPQDFESVPKIRVPWLHGSRILQESAWVNRALLNNIELAGQRILISQATKGRDLSEREILPDLSLSAFYTQETADQTERLTGFGLSIPLPLWNQNRAEIRSKQHKIRAEEHRLSLKERKIKSLAQKLLAEYVSGQKIATEYSEETLAVLESQMVSMEKEFRKKRVDFLLFLELDIQVAETVNRALNAQLHLADTVASLHFLARDKNLIADLPTF